MCVLSRSSNDVAGLGFFFAERREVPSFLSPSNWLVNRDHSENLSPWTPSVYYFLNSSLETSRQTWLQNCQGTFCTTTSAALCPVWLAAAVETQSGSVPSAPQVLVADFINTCWQRSVWSSESPAGGYRDCPAYCQWQRAVVCPWSRLLKNSISVQFFMTCLTFSIACNSQSGARRISRALRALALTLPFAAARNLGVDPAAVCRAGRLGELTQTSQDEKTLNLNVILLGPQRIHCVGIQKDIPGCERGSFLFSARWPPPSLFGAACLSLTTAACCLRRPGVSGVAPDICRPWAWAA